MNAPLPCLASRDDARRADEEGRAARRELALERLMDEEAVSPIMPEDLASLVGWQMSGTPDERRMWEAYRSNDDTEVGRIVRKFIAVVRDEAAGKRATKRMQQLERREYEGD